MSKDGDAGVTYVLCGQKFSKSDNIIHFVGTVDELNSHLGLLKAWLCHAAALSNEDAPQSTCQFIEAIQKKLMKLMSHASDVKNDKYFFSKDDVSDLEKEIERLTEKLPKIAGFVLPGKNITEAQIQIARTVARRAERLFFAIGRRQLCPEAGAYLNRLSGYLFLLSQYTDMYA